MAWFIPKGDSLVIYARSVHAVREHECSLADPAGAPRCDEKAAGSFFQQSLIGG